MKRAKQIEKPTTRQKKHLLGQRKEGVLTSSRTIADINAIRRFRLNSRPVESTAADLKQIITYFKKKLKKKYRTMLNKCTDVMMITCQHQYQI